MKKIFLKLWKWLTGYSHLTVRCYDGVYLYDKKIRTGKTKLRLRSKYKK
jgi:hypothetical protein